MPLKTEDVSKLRDYLERLPAKTCNELIDQLTHGRNEFETVLNDILLMGPEKVGKIASKALTLVCTNDPQGKQNAISRIIKNIEDAAKNSQ